MYSMRVSVVAAALLFLVLSPSSFATPYYVSDSTGDDANTGLSWAAAKKTIQAGVDAAADGDTVLVTNGVYDSGSRNEPAGTNRVVISMGIKVQSVNGPEATIIDGAAAMRCVYLATNSASLVGFTLTNGYAYGSGGGAYGNFAVLSNCVISGNRAVSDFTWAGGGGVYQGTLYNSIIKGNRAPSGGGLNWCEAHNSMVSENIATFNGGGVLDCPLIRNCIIEKNTANEGGGGYYGSYENCTIVSNAALLSGGGVSQSGTGSKNNVIYYNTAPEAENCANSAHTYTCSTPLLDGDGNISGLPQFAGGNYGLALDSPCVNTGTNEDWMIEAVDFAGNPRIALGAVDMGALEFQPSCLAAISPTSATYGVAGGSGTLQITSDPDCSWTVYQTAEWISLLSPSNGTGSATLNYQVNSNSGNWRSSRIYVGGKYCNIQQAGPPSKPTSPSPINNSYARTTDVVLRWMDEGGADGYRVYLGTNMALSESDLFSVQASSECATGGLQEGAYYWRVDATNISGYTIGDLWSFTVWTSGIHVATNGASVPPYLSWATASTSIGMAVATAQDGDTVLVSNGVYSVGSGGAGNRIRLLKPITLKSVNGPDVTVVDGGQSTQCFEINNANAVVDGLTIAHGKYAEGGGVHLLAGTLKNSIVVSNEASGSSFDGEYFGGGIYQSGGLLKNCMVANNIARHLDNQQVNHTARGGGLCLAGGVVEGCVIRNNSVYAYSSGNDFSGYSTAFASGGGISASAGTISGCLISDNRAGPNGYVAGQIFQSKGAGIYGAATVVNCTIVSNNAVMGFNGNAQGGGIYGSEGSVVNTIIYDNRVNITGGSSNHYSTLDIFTNCCSMPLPPGSDNLEADPLFADEEWRVASNSPCIDAGANQAWMAETTDLDGNPRITGGAVDMGAYEFNSTDQDGDGLPNDWEEEYFGGPTNGNPNALCANGADTVRQAFIAGLDPTDPAARFALHLAQPLTWNSTSGRQYTVYRTTNLLEDFQPLQTGLVGGSFTDVVHGAELKNFYKIGVELAP